MRDPSFYSTSGSYMSLKRKVYTPSAHTVP